MEELTTEEQLQLASLDLAQARESYQRLIVAQISERVRSEYPEAVSVTFDAIDTAHPEWCLILRSVNGSSGSLLHHRESGEEEYIDFAESLEPSVELYQTTLFGARFYEREPLTLLLS